jgi:hypothetical protein
MLLAAAVVEVRDKPGNYVPCRALLDSGSQSHFITDKCAQHVKLPRTQTRTSIQGINNVNTATQHSVSLQLRSKHKDWHTTLNCAVLPSITGTTLPMKLDTSSWKIPSDINLADKHFNQLGGIDLLIGADLFYEMLQPGRHTRPGNYPVLQETVLGWTVAGRTPANTTPDDVTHAFILGLSNMDHFIDQFWEAESMEPSTMTTSQKACEKPLHKHNPTEKGKVANNQPNKMKSIQAGISYLSKGQGPRATNCKLGQTSNLKAQDHNFIRKQKETIHTMPVRFQEGNKLRHRLPNSTSKTKGSTTDQIATGRSATPSSSTTQ